MRRLVTFQRFASAGATTTAAATAVAAPLLPLAPAPGALSASAATSAARRRRMDAQRESQRARLRSNLLLATYHGKGSGGERSDSSQCSILGSNFPKAAELIWVCLVTGGRGERSICAAGCAN